MPIDSELLEKMKQSDSVVPPPAVPAKQVTAEDAGVQLVERINSLVPEWQHLYDLYNSAYKIVSGEAQLDAVDSVAGPEIQMPVDAYGNTILVAITPEQYIDIMGEAVNQMGRKFVSITDKLAEEFIALSGILRG